MGKGRHRSGIRVVIRRHVHSLHGSDGAGTGGGNAFLQLTHFGGEGRLVTYRGRHTTKKRRHFRTRHGEAENVVYEEQHVLALITEVFRHGECGQRHTKAHTGGFIHLTINHHGIFHNAVFDHFTVQAGSFAGTFTHTSEHGITLMHGSHRADELHDDNGFASSSAAEDTSLTTLGKGSDKVDDLDTGFEDFHTGGLFFEGRRRAVNGIHGGRLNITLAVDGVTQHVEDATQGRGSYRDCDRGAC